MHALSTTKAKYMALSGCVQEGLWLKFFICSLHQSLSVSLYVHADNTAIISLAIMPSNHSNAHHINTCFHFIHEHVDHEVFELFWTSIFHNIADILTKPLECHIFAKHCVVLFLVLCWGGVLDILCVRYYIIDIIAHHPLLWHILLLILQHITKNTSCCIVFVLACDHTLSLLVSRMHILSHVSSTNWGMHPPLVAFLVTDRLSRWNNQSVWPT